MKSQEQYETAQENGLINANEIYLTPDELDVSNYVTREELLDDTGHGFYVSAAEVAFTDAYDNNFIDDYVHSAIQCIITLYADDWKPDDVDSNCYYQEIEIGEDWLYDLISDSMNCTILSALNNGNEIEEVLEFMGGTIAQKLLEYQRMVNKIIGMVHYMDQGVGRVCIYMYCNNGQVPNYDFPINLTILPNVRVKRPGE